MPIVKDAGLPARSLPRLYVPAYDCCEAWDPICLFLGSSPSVSTYYSGLLLLGTKAEKADLWRITITELQVFVLIWFIAAAREGIFRLKKAGLGIVAEGLGLLIPMPDRLARYITDFGFFGIIYKMGFDPVLRYVAFCLGREVDLSCVDVKNLFFLCHWRTKEVLGLTEELGHERMR